jgi:ParB-like chromosome segregation protein Spo0J
MKSDKLRGLSVQELVARFEIIALAQDRALLYDEIAKFNRLFDEMDAVKQELRSRPGDGRRALVSLYAHPNAQVRLKAAVATLAVEPEAARRELETIAASKEFPQAGDAGMTLSGLDDGTFKPI